MKPCRFPAPLLAALLAVPASADATDRLADLQAALASMADTLTRELIDVGTDLDGLSLELRSREATGA